MIKKAISVAVVFVLVVCFSCASVLANNDSDSKKTVDKTPPAAAKTEANEKLKADVAKLVAEAKAGKLKVPAQHFPQPKRNNLSTGAKVAIVAGIAGAVIFLILWYTTGPGSD